ncbi:tetratricopeptide repeat protein [Pontibacter sp. MBLB2868]|uniref:tetratricopeptide repeat protein n=1 Tax=Pontibacter sp. MBLB2868 TaxID=3451555 RepID=UPI003F74DF48
MRHLIYIGLLLFTFGAYAQTDNITSVQSRLEETSDVFEQVKLLCELSKLNVNTSLSTSLAYANKAVQLAEHADCPTGLAYAYNAIGVAYDKSGDYNGAAEYYYRSLRIREELKDSVGLSASYNNIGSIYNIQNNFEKATEFYEKSLDIAVALHDTVSIAMSYNNLGSIYQKKQDLNKALNYILKSLHLKQKLGDKESIVLSLNNVGYIYSDMGGWDKAISYHKRALELLPPQDSSLSKAYSLYGLAQAYMFGGFPEQALPFALRNLEVVKTIKSKEEIKIGAELLNEIYIKLGDYKKAHNYLSLYDQYKDSVSTTETDTKIAKLQLQYDKEKAEQENKLLKAERDLQEQDMGRKNLLQYFTISLLLMSVVLAVVFFMGRQRLHRFNKLLILKNNSILEQSAALTHKQEELQKQAVLLQQQKTELEKLNNVKDKLFSIIAHDLRGPLVTLKGLLNVFSRGAVPPEKMKTFISAIETSQQNSLWLLDNLLLWAKAQMNGLKVEPGEVNISKLVKQNIKLLQPQAEHKGLKLISDIDPELLLFADKEMTDLVIRNLVSNAIKFSKQGDEITVKADCNADKVTVKVVDSGIGILPEKLGTLFTGHNNSSSPGTANEKGSGLGLQLCRYFIEQNGGQIWAESELGVGSNFSFRLPAVLKAVDAATTEQPAELEMA